MLIQLSEYMYIPGCHSCRFRFQRKLRNNKVRVTAADFPAFLYPNDGFDPDDLESGLFRSPILVQVSVIFLFCLILHITSNTTVLQTYFHCAIISKTRFIILKQTESQTPSSNVKQHEECHSRINSVRSPDGSYFV